MKVMSNQDDGKLDFATISIGDEMGAIKFASCKLNSFELSLSTKDYVKVKLGFVSCGFATADSITTVADYKEDIPVASNSQISCPKAGVKFTGITISGEIPVDQDYYAIGSKQLVDLLQSGNGTLKGTLTLAASDWIGLYNAGGSCGDIGTINLNMYTSKAACVANFVKCITITNVKISDASGSGNGRSRFDKTINWRAEVDKTTNNQLFFDTPATMP